MFHANRMLSTIFIDYKLSIRLRHLNYSMVNRLTVTVGDITLSQTESSEQVFGVVTQTPHEDYDSSLYLNDIMILTLQVSFKLLCQH